MVGPKDPIPMLDLPAQHRPLVPQIMDAVRGILEKGNFVLGDVVERCEGKIAAYLGVSQAVGVASGTDALSLALQAVDVGPGDEVITPVYSFFAIAEAIDRRDELRPLGLARAARYSWSDAARRTLAVYRSVAA